MVDVLSTVKTILDAGWAGASTDNITPTVQYIVDAKTIDLANNDYILLYEIDEPIDVFGLGAVDWAHNNIVSLDIRTTYKRVFPNSIRAHLIKMKDEAIRILKSKVANPDSTYELMTIIRRRDLSDKSTGLGRMVIDVSLKHWGA